MDEGLSLGNEDIRGTEHGGGFGEEVGEVRLRQFGHGLTEEQCMKYTRVGPPKCKSKCIRPPESPETYI